MTARSVGGAGLTPNPHAAPIAHSGGYLNNRQHLPADIRELAVPPGNRLERLRGSRSGQYSIRINDEYRICYRWEAGYADGVEITDYH